jgi:hypothetical protein
VEFGGVFGDEWVRLGVWRCWVIRLVLGRRAHRGLLLKRYGICYLSTCLNVRFEIPFMEGNQKLSVDVVLYGCTLRCTMRWAISSNQPWTPATHSLLANEILLHLHRPLYSYSPSLFTPALSNAWILHELSPKRN